MRCGLFGKLPSKRDFVAVAAPRAFLATWEPWLGGGIAASRMTLAGGWQAAFLQAPIWRFWLGADLCGGAPVLGALMPSVDGVGRYFPLTVFGLADAGEDLPPPEFDGQEAWFASAEDLLLSALAEGATFEAVSGSLGGLPPLTADVEPMAAGFAALRDGTVSPPLQAPSELPLAFAALRRRDHRRAYAGQTCWWTAGGGDFAPRAAAFRGMPDPYHFTGLLTGAFGGGA